MKMTVCIYLLPDSLLFTFFLLKTKKQNKAKPMRFMKQEKATHVHKHTDTIQTLGMFANFYLTRVAT